MGVLTHVALFTWRPGTTDEQVAELSAGLAEGNFDFAVVARFDSTEGYRAYAAHPAHRELIDRLIKPMRDRRAGLRFES